MLKRILNRVTHRIHTLPVLVLMPHSRCNCRCVMCDIWKANQYKNEISDETLMTHVHHFRKLSVKDVIFSGGEALMHSNLWKLCAILRENHMSLTLLSTGLLLKKNAAEIVINFKEVIVSLDGSQAVHDRIRNIPRAYEQLVEGIHELKKLKPGFRITARCVLQRDNFHDFTHIIRAAKEMELNAISFLPADISTSAFNRPEHWANERVSEIALDRHETEMFERHVERSFIDWKNEYRSGFIAERPEKMRKIVQYYKAINGVGDLPEVNCNAPWVSAVIESDGSVMPCFFHKPYGNIFNGDLMDILNSPESIAFRRNLDIAKDPVCSKCVCSLKLGLT